MLLNEFLVLAGQTFGGSGGGSASLFVSLGTGLVAVICAWFTYRASKDRVRLDKSLGAIEGFDKLTEDQRIELNAAKVELKDTRLALNEAERIVHQQGFKIVEQEREIAALKLRVETLEAKCRELP